MKTKPVKEKNVVSDYFELIAKKPKVIVDVTLPSGAVFKLERPNVIAAIFKGLLPDTATNEAADAWKEKGVSMPSGDSAYDEAEESRKFALRTLEARNDLIRLSVEPKIVLTKTDPAKKEIAYFDIDRDDFNFLLQWVMAGGDSALRLKMFPE